jgi:hypothetical protein
VLSPVLTHVPCALDHQRRIAEATREAVARSVARRRRPGRGTRRALSPRDAGPRGEDVWASLRF